MIFSAMPPSALVGGNTVFVLADGAVHARKVTIVDRTPNEVLAGSGLQSGDQIVSSGADTLKDGQKASQ